MAIHPVFVPTVVLLTFEEGDRSLDGYYARRKNAGILASD